MARRIPEDPIVRSIVNMVRSAQFDRRQMLKGAAVGAAGLGALTLASCAPRRGRRSRRREQRTEARVG